MIGDSPGARSDIGGCRGPLGRVRDSPRAAVDAPPSGGHDIAAASSPAARLSAARLSAADVGDIISTRPDKSKSTRRAYGREWRAWAAWADADGCSALPADVERLAAWIRSRREAGHSHRTLLVAGSALALGHRIAGLPSPRGADPVAVEMTAARLQSPPPRQARPLGRDDAAAVIAAARRPRRHPSGRPETAEETAERAALDEALIRLMRDALLRVSEAAALRWADIERSAGDGLATVTIRRSKTDQAGIGAVKLLPPETVAAVERLPGAWADPDAAVIGGTPAALTGRLRRAAAAAGIHGISGHSCRVGAAQDLAAAGADLPDLMEAGRWQSATMAARYTAAQRAARGAVARYAAAMRIPEPDPEPADG